MGASRRRAEEAHAAKAWFCVRSFEQLHSRKRLSRPRPEPIERELSWLSGLHVHVHEIVILLGRFTLPIMIQRVAFGNFDVCPTGKDRILFRSSAAEHEIL